MRVLIFSASAGNGHNSTAHNISEKIKEKDPSAIVEIVDAYKSYAPKLNAWAMEQGYFLVCNHFVWLYNHFFKKSERTNAEYKDKSKANRSSYPLMYGMLNKIYDFKPDVIVSTYFFCSIALTNLKRCYSIPAKIICMTLDYGISPYWECCADGLDYMFLTGDYMIDSFKKLGYKDEQLIVSGIPIADKFFVNKSQKQSRNELNLDESLFTLLVMKASFFPITNAKLMEQFSLIKDKIQIIIINGKNEKSKLDLDNRIQKLNLIHKIVNIGFTDQIPDYLNSADIVLGKAGGLSTTEQIKTGTPSLIVNNLPQQEVYNKEYLINNNCALPVTKDTIAGNIEYLLQNQIAFNSLKQNALKIRKEYPLDVIYKTIASCPPADYSKIIFASTKKQVIHNVHTKRKEAIKAQKQNSDK